MTNTIDTRTSGPPLEADLERALQSLSVPAGMIDPDGELLWTNHAAAELLGMRAGDSFLDALPAELHDAGRARIARTLRGMPASMYRLELLGRDGRRVRVLLRASLVHRDGVVVGVLGMVFPMRTLHICRVDAQPLTPRQEQVLRLLAEGLDTEEIAERLGVALETARNHIRGLMSRLEVHSRLGAVLEGLRRGFLSLDELHG